jgi:putative DNA primase/helicase
MVAAKKQDEDDKPGVRIFMPAKSNIGPDEGGFEYELQQAALYSNPDIVASRVVFGNAIEGKARDLLAEAETVKDKDDDKAASLREATDFLIGLLLDGPMPTKEVPGRRAVRCAGLADHRAGKSQTQNLDRQ